ncbi:MAG: hypothetical protein FWD28_01100 [Treponema sp.]|nr:hypothetical protein [Treponema sp.]
MKRIVLPLLLIISVLLALSCQRNERTELYNRDGDSISEGAGTSARSTGFKPGFALPISPGLYVVDGPDDGTEATRARWRAQMSLGEKITIGEPRRLTWINSNNVASVLNFVEIRSENGTEGYALANQVTEGGMLAVVIDDRANLHRTARTVDVTGTIITRRTVLVYYPETESNGFVEVRGFDPGRDRYIDPSIAFVRLNTLSRRDSDIQSSILLQTALAQPANQAVRREALLESALLDYPDSVFNAEIFEIKYPANTGVVFEE